MAQDPYKYFRVEARDLLDQFAKGVLDLEKSGSGAAAVQRLLRLAHTLKGAARVVRQSQIADRAHAIEDALSPYRDSAKGFAREQIDTVLAHLDQIDEHIGALAQAEAADHAGEGNVAADEVLRTVRTDVAETDAVLDGVAETHALLGALRSAGQGLEQAKHLAELLMAQLAPQRATLGDFAWQSGKGEHLLATGSELRRRLGRVERDLGSTIDQMDRELRQLRDAAERLRLGSAAALLTALERAARNVGRKTSKQVTFEGRGGDIRLDSHVIETIQGALVQLVRNAVAHGIEPEAERRAAGKPEIGRICVNVVRRGRGIVFECSDDGRGLDLDAVRRVAVERGIAPSHEAGAEDLVRMLLRGGISTSKIVTEVSGRGVGLDVVRESVERLGGEIVVRTNAGAGTTFELVIPPSLAAMDALMVEAEGAVAAIPLGAVRSTVRLAAPDISRAAAGASIVHEHKAIAFVPLSAACGGAPWAQARNWTAIVVATGAGIAAIGVDRLLSTGTIVARPLPDGMSASPIVAGALLDAEGNPQLVLDPDALVAAALGTPSGAHSEGGGEHGFTARRHSVLVVDDSLTTRMLEQSILESAGYDVDVALSGEEALECVTRKSFALILVDVEMPGIDGFTFIERIRAEPALRHIPAILVTSRAAPEDRRRGRDVGAQGYIVKSAFDQAELLTLIRSLTG